jgi:putative nucleotidyltransferase with HDIG domain
LASKILQTKSERWRIVEREASVAVRAAYEFRQQAQKIRSDVEDDMLAARQRMLEALRARQQFGANPSEVEKAFLLASWAVRYPNLVVNERKTENAREAAREAVPAVSRIVVPGTVVVEAGTRLDAARWAELQDLNLVAPRFDLATLIARLVVCGVLVAFAAGYVAHFHPQLVNQPTALWLTAMVPVAFVALFRWGLRIPHGDHAMVPVAATAALSLTILVNARIGIMAGFVVTALCALMARAESGLIIATLLSACIGVLSVSEIASRSHVVRGALILSASNAVLALAMGILREASLDETISLACWGTLAGGFSVLAAVALSQLLEGPFNITTHLRLLELSGPGENVMRRMQAEAPGTYTHSLMVAMLSEAAAKAVGADLLLCRVGGMYHDIGKLRRPHCFVENQSGENVHDRLAPQVSALLISAHVRDGVELGRAIRLPQPVLDIIAQHHGCSLISYFYHRAASEQTVNVDGTMTTPDESLFRYPGPRPQSKESAIVLLADTVEASSRAIPGLTPERLEQHIQTMIAQRLAEGELSECELTMRDLGTIEKTFAHVLRGVLHHRIEYPDPARELNAPEGDGQSWMHEALSDPWDGTDRRDTQREREQARHKVNRPINKNPDQGTSETEKTAAVLSRRGRRRAREQSSSIAKTKSPDIESQTYGNTSKYPQKAEVKTSLRTPKYGARLREANKRDEAGGSSTIREGDQPASAAATGPAATTLGNLERRRRKLAAFASRNGTNGSHDGSHEAPNGNGRTADSNGTEHYREASGESVPANGAVGQHSTGA